MHDTDDPVAGRCSRCLDHAVFTAYPAPPFPTPGANNHNAAADADDLLHADASREDLDVTDLLDGDVPPAGAARSRCPLSPGLYFGFADAEGAWVPTGRSPSPDWVVAMLRND